METLEESKPAVDAVDREIARGVRGLRFSAPVESLYLDEYLRVRARMVPLWAMLGTAFYLFAIWGDLTMMSDVAPTLVALRLGVFVPYVGFVVFAMRRWPSATSYDLLALGVGVIGLALPMTALVGSASAHLFVYQTGSVGTLAFFAIVLRPRFRTILTGLAAMVAIQLATTGLNGRFDPVTYSGIVTFYLTLGSFLALAAYFAERVDRLNFLNRLRGQALQGELVRLSRRDPMTGLYNRYMLLRTRDELWAPGVADRSLSAVMIDIDNFKLYNDIYGHIDGDACIRRVADTVREQVGARGRVFRYGGEEMLVLMPDAALDEARGVAESIHKAIGGLHIAHRGLSPDGRLTASIGVASAQPAQETLEGVLRRADAALYAAKRAGRNRVHVAASTAGDSEQRGSDARVTTAC